MKRISKLRKIRLKQIEAEIKRQEEEARKKAEAAGQKYNTVSIGNIKFIWRVLPARGLHPASEEGSHRPKALLQTIRE